MTSRQLYEAILIELRKENAPNILLEDFNYLANKAISQYVNKRYNIYDINQQTTDDLRVLKATAILTPEKVDDYNDLSTLDNDGTYFVTLPSDYLHMLNCICIYDVKKTYKCYDKGDTWRAAAKRLTADAYSIVLDNFWNRPTYKRPYYYIHNVNTREEIPTNPYNETGYGTDVKAIDKLQREVTTTNELSQEEVTTIEDIVDGKGNHISIVNNNNRIPSSIKIGEENHSLIEKAAEVRYGNTSKVRCEIRYGTDNGVFELAEVYIDYIKAPQYIRLTQKQLDKTEDISQQLEFPDYVCQEIINELVHIIMENISDMRLQTHPVVSQSIANPAQQQTEPVAQQQPT